MSEVEFERLAQAVASAPGGDREPSYANANGDREPTPPDDDDATPPASPRSGSPSGAGARSRARGKPAKPRRVQRMFAVEEDLDKKLWLYAIHLGKDRSEVINDLLRPVVASMVLYDSRDRRSSSSTRQGQANNGNGVGPDPSEPEGQGG
jgi:hypothetical protein